MKLKVKKAPTIDRDKLLVRINSNDKPDSIKWYDYIQLKVREGNRAIVCKLHGDDIPEIEDKQNQLIHINEPLRGKLRVKVGDNLDFSFKKVSSGFWVIWYYFIRYHPDDIVRLSTWLGIFAFLLGVISLVVAFSS